MWKEVVKFKGEIKGGGGKNVERDVNRGEAHREITL